MKINLKNILFAVIILTFSTVLTAQQTNESINVMLFNYLTGYCDEGEEDTFIGFIQKNKNKVQSMLMNYVNEGVPESLMDSLKRSAATQYKNRQQLLSKGLDFGLGKEDLEFIKKQSQEDFTNQKIEDYRSGFMSQVIFGLSLIESDETNALLKKIAADEKNPNQRFAQNALNKVYLKK